MHLLTTVYRDNDYLDGFDYASIVVTHELAVLILRRAEAFTQLKANDKDLADLRFWDYTPDFFDYPLDYTSLDELKPGTLDAAVETIDSGDTEVVELKNVTIPEELSRVDCCLMVVNSGRVRWKGFPKHASNRISTAEIDLDTIREAARVTA